MTVLFRLKNNSSENSIAKTFVNLKEKLDEYQVKEIEEFK